MADISKIMLAGETVARNLKDKAGRDNLDTLIGTGHTAGSAVLGAAAWLAVDSAVASDGAGVVTGAKIKEYVDAQVGSIHKFDVVIDNNGTTSGPSVTASAETMYKIYLVPDTDASAGSYIEWITIRTGSEGSYEYKWEKIGSTKTDLTGYVPKTRKVGSNSLEADISVVALQSDLGLKALAYKDAGNVTYTVATGVSMGAYTPAGSVSVVLADDSAVNATIASKADFTPAGSITGSAISDGSISVTLKHDADVSATIGYGSYTPAGSVSLSLDDEGTFQPGGSNASSVVTITDSKATVLQSVNSAGVLPSFTDGKIGTYTSAALSEGFYSAGTAATWTGATYSAPSLGTASTGNFASEGIVAAVATNDSECLVFSAAATAAAVTAQGTFSAGNVDFGTFSGGSVTTIDTSRFSGGSWTAGTFNAGSLATFKTAEVIQTITSAEAAAQTFTGLKYKPAFAGTTETELKTTSVSYKKAEINTQTFTGVTASLGFTGTKVSELIPTQITYVPKKVSSSTFTGESAALSASIQSGSSSADVVFTVNT